MPHQRHARNRVVPVLQMLFVCIMAKWTTLGRKAQGIVSEWDRAGMPAKEFTVYRLQREVDVGEWRQKDGKRIEEKKKSPNFFFAF